MSSSGGLLSAVLVCAMILVGDMLIKALVSPATPPAPRCIKKNITLPPPPPVPAEPGFFAHLHASALDQTQLLRNFARGEASRRSILDGTRNFLRMLKWVLTGSAMDCSPEKMACLSTHSKGTLSAMGFTTVGFPTLKAVETAIANITRDGIPGDFVETGGWRFGVSIFAQLVHNCVGRRSVVWVCDSF
eukprot:RCo050265